MTLFVNNSKTQTFKIYIYLFSFSLTTAATAKKVAFVSTQFTFKRMMIRCEFDSLKAQRDKYIYIYIDIRDSTINERLKTYESFVFPILLFRHGESF
jgi:hypothetical protein